MNKNLDCVIVGHNEKPYRDYARKAKQMQKFSGGYREVLHNSVLLDGERLTFLDLLNRVVKKAIGKDIVISAFDPAHYGCCYLMSILNKRGYNVSMVNTFESSKEELKKMLNSNPKFVAITTTYYIDSAPIKEVVDFVRTNCKNTKIVIGGPFIYNLFTVYDDKTAKFILNDIKADIFVNDLQGEAALLKLLDNYNEKDDMNLGSIDNIIYRSDNDFIMTNINPENNSLNENVVDWSIFDPNFLKPLTSTRISRSCPCNCAYCVYPQFGGKHNRADNNLIENELKTLNNIGVQHVLFFDETINMPLDQFKDLCRRMIDNKFTFSWSAYFRSSHFDDETVGLMKKSNCIAVCIGTESGDDNLLKNMDKGTTSEKTLRAIQQFNDAGIITFATFVVGFPGETKETIQKTYEFIEKAKPTYYFLFLWYYHTLASIHKRAKEFDLVGSGYTWHHSTMTWKDAADSIDYLFKSVKSSTIMTLADFTFPTLPYLMKKGIPFETMNLFSKIAQKMLVDSLDDVPKDFSDEEAKLVSLFKNVKFN